MERQFSLCDHFSLEKPYTLFQAVLREDAEDLAAAVADHPGLVVAGGRPPRKDWPGAGWKNCETGGGGRAHFRADPFVLDETTIDRDNTVVAAIITVLSSSSLPSATPC